MFVFEEWAFEYPFYKTCAGKFYTANKLNNYFICHAGALRPQHYLPDFVI